MQPDDDNTSFMKAKSHVMNGHMIIHESKESRDEHLWFVCIYVLYTYARRPV
jgi:hypothetical protein